MASEPPILLSPCLAHADPQRPTPTPLRSEAPPIRPGPGTRHAPTPAPAPRSLTVTNQTRTHKHHSPAAERSRLGDGTAEEVRFAPVRVAGLGSGSADHENDPRNIPPGFSIETPWWDLPDSDSDGLPDFWETDGVYVNGKINDLAAAGARVGQVDAFLYLDVVAGERWNSRIETKLKEAFRVSPLNIRLHIIRSPGTIRRDSIPPGVSAGRSFFESVQSQTSSGSETSFLSTTWAESDSTPQLAKYVCACPDHLGGSGVGGEAQILGDNFVVTMNESQWLESIRRETNGRAISSGPVTDFVGDRLNAITTMHELGHTYGLLHHGTTTEPVYDVAYKSIMSYSYNAFGVPQGTANGLVYSIDFSRESSPGLFNLDWRVNTVLDRPYYGALTFIRGQNGERPTFYSATDPSERLSLKSNLVDRGFGPGRVV